MHFAARRHHYVSLASTADMVRKSYQVVCQKADKKSSLFFCGVRFFFLRLLLPLQTFPMYLVFRCQSWEKGDLPEP